MTQEKNQKEAKKLIVREQGIAYQNSKIRGILAVECPNTIKTGTKILRKSSLYYTEWSSEKAALSKEYNEKLEVFLAYQKEQFEKIFGEN